MKNKLIKPQLVFNSKGEYEYFAVGFSNRVFGNTVNCYKRRVGEVETNITKKTPYDTWLLADCPENLKNPEPLPAQNKEKQNENMEN